MSSYKKHLFFDNEAFAIRADTIAFLMVERAKLDDVLWDLWNEGDHYDDFDFVMKYPELCDEAIRLDKRIEQEAEDLVKPKKR